MSGHCRYCYGRVEDRTPNRTLERADRIVRAHADTDSLRGKEVEILCDGEVETLCDSEEESA
ncbi:hypothetical protein CP556_23260 [Natrinema sp. CBA1119]|uniref:hypothetical protein n=1 Tax=Natrinema sp. CBA1119 TaxID=1608465 RepID=UPI000BF99C66|nr:hypothetical protein [Natrinema sp. CBA1119]PGF14001.1 hypothetical protein CP556_23260 [Natrinema sp. CBA1119]